MMNNFSGIGRLARDPELRYTQSGIAVTSFMIAINRNFTNGDGEREADFVPVVVWRELAELVANHCFKGQLVGVSGRFQSRSYEDDNGNMRYVNEIVGENVDFLQWKEEEGNEQKQPTKGGNANKGKGNTNKGNTNKGNQKNNNRGKR